MPEPPAAPLSWYRTRPPDLPPPRDRTARRRRALDALACLGVAALCFHRAVRETLFLGDRDFYHRLLLGAPTVLALLLNIVALAAVGVLCVEMIRRVRHPALRWPRVILRAIRRVAIVASPVTIFTMTMALWMFFEIAAGPTLRRVDPVPLATSAPSLRRVVWLVFSELDQGIAFESRPAGLELPELDSLRRESLYADAARAPGRTIETSMTALIGGRAVVAAAPVNAGDLELTFADGKTARWSAQPSVFSRARAYGYDTVVVGSHLPYRRVLGGALGAAEWRPSVAYERTRGETVSRALLAQWASLVPPLQVRRLSVERFADLGELALRAAKDDRFGLVLLHLPIPALPGIYDPSMGHLTTWNFTGADAEYLDNLALADRVVGELRRVLDRARLLDRTWLVVTSDRAGRASRDDQRVPFLVRPPEGGRTVHVDGAFDTLATHDLILAILRGSVADGAGAVSWLTRAASPGS